MLSGKTAGQRGGRGKPGVLCPPEEPRGMNQSKGTLAGDQRAEEAMWRLSPLQLAPLRMVTCEVTDPVWRDFKDYINARKHLLPKRTVSGDFLTYPTEFYLSGRVEERGQLLGCVWLRSRWVK